MDFLGGSPIPKSKIDQKVNIFVKTKNAPKGLKCKINHSFFGNRDSHKGGGGLTFGENSQKIPFFLLGVAPNDFFPPPGFGLHSSTNPFLGGSAIVCNSMHCNATHTTFATHPSEPTKQSNLFHYIYRSVPRPLLQYPAHFPLIGSK